MTAIIGCTGCQRCDEVCPESLEPSRLIAFVSLATTASGINATQAERLDNLRKEGLRDCSDCGECTAVCPSHLPLESLLQEGKTLLDNEAAEFLGSQHWLSRFQKRQRRVETLKVERKLKARTTLAQDAEEPGIAATASSILNTEKPSQNQSTDKTTKPTTDDNAAFSRDSAQSDIAAAVARVKAKRAAQKQKSEEAQ